MATGDDALAAGMALTAGTALANTIDTEINLTRDYIAQRTSAVTSIAKGGTGATTASAARTNLGLGTVATQNTVPVGNGGTGATSAVNARTNLGVYSTAQVDAAFFPIAGGTDITGSTSVLGNFYLPNSVAATSSFTVCYINGDGRVSRGSSSERYKKFISDRDPLALGDIFPQLVRFQMKEGDGSWILGYIAERLDEVEDTQPFVVRVEGQVESIDFIQLLIAQVANLNARVKALEEG